MDTLIQNLRYTARTLARSPGFAVVAILTLALGIGANATIFSLVDAILLRPPAHVAQPERLVAVYTSDYSGPLHGASSYPDVRDFRLQKHVFSGVLAYSPRVAGIGEGDRVQRVGLEVVTENYFDVLGVRPAEGRFFSSADGAPGGALVAVVSHRLWQREVARGTTAVGEAIIVNGRPVTVIGVAPEGFSGRLRGMAVDLWMPAAGAAALGVGGGELESRGDRGFLVLARLAPGVQLRDARARVAVLARQLHAAYPGLWNNVRGEGRTITLLPESAARVPPQLRARVLGFTGLLLATVVLVLLVCCANVAGIMLARAARRSREIGVRLSLGASRRRIVGQLLTESVTLSLVAGAVALILSAWLVDLVSGLVPELPVPVDLDLTPDARVLGFTSLVALGTGILFGLAPAVKASRLDVISVLKADLPTVDMGKRLPLQSALVVAQMAISLLLVVSALLFARTLEHAAGIDPGFRVADVLLVPVEPRTPERDGASTAAVGLAMRERVAALPGVRGVSWAATPPLDMEYSRMGTWVEGHQRAPGEDMEFGFNVVGPHYFETIGLPLVRGRGFTDADRQGAPGVVVVNESFARRFWPNQDPLGKRVSTSGPTGQRLEVVGVARDAKYSSLADAPKPYIYLPALQQDGWSVVLLVRAPGDPDALLPLVRSEAEAAAPAWTVRNPRTLADQVGTSLLPQRVAAGVLGLFGALALLLASIGLYGVVAYSVARRTREIGIRVALGARGEDVVRLVLRQSITLVAAGLAIGLPLAWGATRLLGSLPLGVVGAEPVTFAGSAALLALVALLASWMPARRAARVDPMVALRNE